MAVPSPDTDVGSIVQWILNVLGALVTIIGGFVTHWVWKLDDKIDAVRTEVLAQSAKGDEALRQTLESIKDDLAEAMKEYRGDLKDWQARQGARWEELSKWRENMIAITPTRTQLDKKLEEIIERLDTRINPLLHRDRAMRKRNDEGED